MGDQGTGGIESRGPESNTTRRLSEPIPNSHEDQIQPQTAKPETVGPESEGGLRRLGVTPISTSGGLSRTASTSSNASGDYRFRPDGGQKSRINPQPVEPPVTKGTLSELDVTKIIHNPKLRHDINFDPELHFRPNLDGEKGRRKQEKANQFWNSLSEQLTMFLLDRDEFMRRYGNGEEWCLPSLLRSVKDIIQTLVPNRDRTYLDEGLNIDLIMQEFGKGMADLEKLASWLSGVLKSHCAPMRDEWVDEMYNQLTNGNRTNNMDELVLGMRSLLSVLEAMKLDVANHQIRCLRPVLIEDTVQFEQRFFLKKIRDRKLDPSPAQMWYASMSREYPTHPSSHQTFGEMAVFFESLTRMVLPRTAKSLPNTFLFDEERVLKLRTDMLDAINLEVCMRVYEDLEQKYRHFESPSTFQKALFADACGFLAPRADDEVSEGSISASNSRPSSMVFSSAGSASSSPRSSLILSTPPTFKSPDDHKTLSQNLYSSLVALLQTSTSSSRNSEARWKAMKDSLALQIFRFTNAPAHVLPDFERDLDLHLCEPKSLLFQAVEKHYHQRLLGDLQKRVKDLKGLTGVGLFSVATGGRLQGPTRSWDGPRDSARDREHEILESSLHDAREEDGVEDMATRLAHLGLLHWRVWGQLVYVGDLDTDVSELDTPMPMVI